MKKKSIAELAKPTGKRYTSVLSMLKDMGVSQETQDRTRQLIEQDRRMRENPKKGQVFTLGMDICRVTRVSGETVHFETKDKVQRFFIKGSPTHQLAQFVTAEDVVKKS